VITLQKQKGGVWRNRPQFLLADSQTLQGEVQARSRDMVLTAADVFHAQGYQRTWPAVSLCVLAFCNTIHCVHCRTALQMASSVVKVWLLSAVLMGVCPYTSAAPGEPAYRRPLWQYRKLLEQS